MEVTHIYDVFTSTPDNTKLFEICHTCWRRACTLPMPFVAIVFQPRKMMYPMILFFSQPLLLNKITVWSMICFKCLTNNNISSFGKMFFIHPLSMRENHGKMTHNNLFILFIIVKKEFYSLQYWGNSCRADRSCKTDELIIVEYLSHSSYTSYLE